jgi:acyl-coenzyme A thioesterase PaaI-like protein
VSVPAGFAPGADLDPAETHVGPFLRRDTKSAVTTGLLVAGHHCNEHGSLHGGVQMALADYTVGVVARFGMGDEGTMTVSFDAAFVDAGRLGEWVEGRAEVVRRTGSLVFVQGRLVAGDRPLLTFSGVVKRLRSRD